MKKPVLLVLASVLLPVGTTCVAGEFDMDAAASLFNTKCSKCHSVDRPRQNNKSQEAWTHTVKRMQSKNPGWFSDDEATTLIEYLSQTQGTK
jgi:hypothetical protein